MVAGYDGILLCSVFPVFKGAPSNESPDIFGWNRMELPAFMNEDEVRAVQREFGTPVYVYDQKTLEDAARDVLAFPNAYGLTVRYAMKALPTAAIIRLLVERGLHIDASSGFEVERAISAGIAADRIRLTAQELPANVEELIGQGVLFTACSLHQLRAFGRLFPESNVCIRVNPGKGTGHSNRTNVGGPSSSFGIWHEHLDDAVTTAQEFGLTITALHTHIGSGGDPELWKHCARLSLAIAARLPDVQTLNLGGGFKVGRFPGESTADLNEIGHAILEDFKAFDKEHGRKLHLEIEPGTYLVAGAGAIVATVIDVVDTGEKGYKFIKVDSGMTENLRPSMYGAQHPITLVPAVPAEPGARRDEGAYIVVGHCCESGDILTPEPGNPEALAPRTFPEPRIGDAVVIGAVGAYGSAMAAKNYNSFPTAPEVLRSPDGTFNLIRTRQTLQESLVNEV